MSDMSAHGPGRLATQKKANQIDNHLGTATDKLKSTRKPKDITPQLVHRSWRCALEEPIGECSLSLQEVVDLVENQCGIAKVKGDWHQRICSIRKVCRYIACNAGLSVAENYSCIHAMRELERSFSKIAQLLAAPDNRGRGSGSARKKFMLIRLAVGNFIGSDLLRALLALAEPHTCLNLEQLSFALLRAKELLIEKSCQDHEQLMIGLGRRI